MSRHRKPLGVAVLGLGVGEQHARAYLETGLCDLRWLVDIDSSRAHRLARDLGVGAVAPDLASVLEDDKIDVVSVASYDHFHADQVIAALRAGKHVFVEKPLCRSAEELGAIAEAWVAGGRPQLRSNLVLRGAPLYRWLREMIAAGDLGEVYSFDGDYLYGRLHKLTAGWRGEIGDYSVMQGGGIHLVDLMVWILGEKPLDVMALGNEICTRESSLHIPDFVAASFRFGSGVVGRITANFGCVHRHQHVVRVFGSKATFISDDAGARLYESRDPHDHPRMLEYAPLPASKGVLIPEFTRAILEELDPEPAFRHERVVMAVCLAADEAVATGARCEVRAA